MLRKEQLMDDSVVLHKSRGSPFFNLPGPFVGFKSKAMDSSDSAKSPTSPLETPVSPKSPPSFKIWDTTRVGLGLVDSLNNENETHTCVLIGSQMRKIHTSPNQKTQLDSPKSLPKNYVISSQFHIGSPKFEPGDVSPSSLFRNRFSMRSVNSEVFEFGVKKNAQLGSSSFAPNLSGSLPISIGSGSGFVSSLSASEIELSEDYTCIISHGPNPKTTHIFGDFLLDSNAVWSLDCNKSKDGDTPFDSDNFLSYCFSCNKKLEQDEDIYMYRGEKAFCSCNCRDKEILFQEEMEKPAASDSLGS